MATLKLRRGSSFTSPQLGEPFYNTDSDTLQLGISGSQFVTFTKLGDINTGSLLLDGGISASGDITASNLRVENDIRLNGSIYLGDEEVDKIYISASLSGSLIPDSGGTFDLGNETETWRTIYVDTGSIGQIELDGITVSDNLTVSGTSSFQTVTELNGTLTEYSQSVQSRLVQLETDTGSQDGRLDNLELFTSSQQTKNTTLENTTSSLEQATSSLESFTGSQEELNVTFATTGSNVFSGSQDITGSIFAVSDVHEFTGSLFVSGAIRFDIPLGANSDIVESDLGNIRINPGFLRTTNATDEPFLTESTRRGGFHNFDSVFVSNKDTGYSTIGFSTNLSRSLDFPSVTLDGTPNEEPGFYASSGSDSFTYYTWLKLQRADEYTDGRITFTTPIISSGSLTAPLQEGYYWVGNENGYNDQVPTSSFTDRIDSLETVSGSQDTRISELEFTGSDHEQRVDNLELTGSDHEQRVVELELTGSDQENRIDEIETTFSSSVDSRLDEIETTFSSSVDLRLDDLETTGSDHESRVDNIELFTSSQEDINLSLQNYTSSNDTRLGIIETETASLDQRLDSFESVSASYARTDLENTFIQRQFFDDIEVSGTASFARIESTTGSAKIIGDAFIILNNDTPTERYAGIKVIDSGSANTTASFQYDGQENNWFYEYTDDGGSTNEYGVTLFGPEYNDIETPVYPKNNYILKGLGGHHISSSRITDDGVQVEIETSLNVDGSITGSSFSGQILSTNGVVSGSSQIVYEQISSIPSGIVSGSSQVTITNTTGFSTFSSSLRTTDEGLDTRITDLETFSSSTDSLYEEISSGTNTLVSGSSQLTSSFDSRYLNTNGDGIVSGSSQVSITNTSGFNDFSESLYNTDASASLDIIEQNLRIIELEHTASFNSSSIVSLEQISSSHESRITNLESTGSDHESRIVSSSDDISNLEISESLLDGRVSELETFSSSLDTEFLNVGGDNVVSGSTGDQLTGSFDQRYALSSSFQDVSSSYVNLVGDFSSDIQNGNINLGDGAFLNVSSSLTPSTPSEVLANAGAIRQYIDDSVGAADITAVIVEDGLSGGGTAGDVSMSLDTGSTHFTDGVLFSLPQGTISGSDQLDLLGYLNVNGDNVFTSSQQVEITDVSGFSTFSSSVDIRLDDLETFSSSLSTDFVTQDELTSATGALEDSISTKLDTGSYNTDSSSFDSRIDNLESFSSSLDDGFVTQTELASATGALETADTELFTTASDHKDRLDEIETTFSSSVDSRLDNIELFTQSIDSTIKTKLDTDGVVSGSSQIVYTDLSSIPSGIVSGSTQITDGSDLVSGSVLRPGGDGVVSGSDQLTSSLVDLSSDQTISGTKTFNDIVVNGTGSFAVIESVSGDAKIIGDAYIILNNDTPTSRYAGFKVLDSGSAGTTASFEYDGQTNDFFYQYTDDGGVTDEFGIALFGPEYNTKGSPTYLSNNTIPKGDGGHHLNDSNISDNGTLITLGSDTEIQGTVIADGIGIGTGSDGTYNLKVDGNIGATGDIVAYISSDRRLKENITRISAPIHKINQLSGYSFEWNEEKQNIYNGKDYGVVAQEVQEIFPELVTERESGYLGVKYDRLVSVLIEAVKELSNEVNELKSKLE